MPQSVLPPDAAKRLVLTLGMLGSAHEGERAAAGLMAHRIVTGAGITWEAALAPLLGPPMASPPPSAHTAAGHIAVVDLCLANAQALTSWDRKFLDSVRGFAKLSEKQREVLDRIAMKCGVGG